MQVIGMHIGSSFAEVCLLRDANGKLELLQAPAYFYLPRQPLKSCLPKYFAELLGETKADAAFVSTQFLERLFNFRLGGSTAQVVTAGFESWPFLSASAAAQGWIEPEKTQPIAARELSFPVQERIDSRGQVLVPLNVDSLAPIAEKLKGLEIKRVCVHFLNAPANPTHQTQAAGFFRQQGFDVFSPSTETGFCEEQRWRRSTLEASFSGTFDEIRSEIDKALESRAPAEAVRFRDQGDFSPAASTSRVGSLFGLDEILFASYPDCPNILQLGLESWRLLKRSPQSVWQSPWGPVENRGATRIELRCQPTSLLEKEISGDVVIHPGKEGYEPGPLCFGRGQKFLVFDLFSEDLRDHEGLRSQMAETGAAKKEFHLKTLCRNGREKEPSRLLKQLRADVFDSIAWDLHLHGDPGPVAVCGFFAPLFISALKERLPDMRLEPKEESLAGLVASAGHGGTR